MPNETQTKEPLARFDRFLALGGSGEPADVDVIMRALVDEPDFTTTRLVDFALSQVSARPAVARIQHYLFNGEAIQRNYAALYFKRREFHSLLEEAFALGLIDEVQAFSS